MVHPPRRSLSTALAALALTVLAVATACTATSDTTSTPTSTSAPSTTSTTSPSCAGVTATKSTHRYATTPGVAADLQSLDLYRPDLPSGCAKAPVLLYVHGGGWIRGDKGNQIRDKVELFAQQQGWLFISVNYRLSPDPVDLTSTTAVRAPTHATDVAAAIGWASRNAADHGGDPTRMAIMGHSAGAHLVSEIGTDESFLADAGVPRSSVPCVASLDTQAYDMADAMAANGPLHENAFGADPAGWRAASPIHQITAGEPLPAFHIVSHATLGWLAKSEAFGAALTAAGGTATVQSVPLDHEGINDAVGQADDTLVTPGLTRFLSDCFAT